MKCLGGNMFLFCAKSNIRGKHIYTEINTSSAQFLCSLSNAVKHLCESTIHKARSLYSTSLLFILLTTREKSKKKCILMRVVRTSLELEVRLQRGWVVLAERICFGDGFVLWSWWGSWHLPAVLLCCAESQLWPYTGTCWISFPSTRTTWVKAIPFPRSLSTLGPELPCRVPVPRSTCPHEQAESTPVCPNYCLCRGPFPSLWW